MNVIYVEYLITIIHYAFIFFICFNPLVPKSLYILNKKIDHTLFHLHLYLYVSYAFIYFFIYFMLGPKAADK